ncbi:serine protease [Zychaea mexicana]|uniref:serine protease n=1 Tax=Zychaea mexicana TaxID=64656 RepID=UPI0022FE2D2C|nr:serine protease [Zychaea mexicana]KAI9493513.1 serine protease [Zychaea mexicana]
MVKGSTLSVIAAAWLTVVNAFPTSYDHTSNHINNDSELLAPLYVPSDAEAISDSYIVILKDHVDSTQALGYHCQWVSNSLVKRDRTMSDYYLDSNVALGIKHTYDSPGWRGYSGKFSLEMLEYIRSSPDVAYVERDTMVYASELQRNAPWGLARISHRDELNLRSFNKYPYEANGGQDIKVFVIDTGINVLHNDFNGRAKWGVTIPDGDDDEDGNGHGSHCAGTIAGKRFGVAKKAMPVAVKVLRSNGSGSMSGVLAGVNWATEQHQIDASEAKAAGKAYKGAVANMSLGGGKSNALNKAVNEAVNAGIIFSVAAGNDNRDACNYSPAGAENAITVGASNIRDERASFSNFGPCVDVFAPGENILSIWRGSKDATNSISGTSMAAPHVAGLAAYFASLEEAPVSPKKIKEKILELASKDKLSNIPKETPNLLIFNDPPKSLF